jgi:hypothetical protein
MTLKKFDYKKPFQTRYGRKAELLTDDLSGTYCLGVKVTDEDNYSRINTYSIDGIYDKTVSNHDLDLINIPQKITKWLNIYCETGYLYATKEEANNRAGEYRNACIKIEFEEGEGLEK